MSLCLATAGGVGIRPRPRIIIWALRDADLEFMHEEIKLAALRESGTFLLRIIHKP